MRRLLIIIGLLFTLTLVGTCGLRIISGAPWIDCLYMAVMNLTTVGQGEPVPLNTAGKLFIIGYLVACLGVFTYCALQLGQLIVEAHLPMLLEKRRMRKLIDELRNHFIVCGMGRMGTTICEYLSQKKEPFVVIDTNEAKLRAECIERGWHYVVGDATDDEALKSAGTLHARALATALPTDAANLYVVLSAHMLAPNLQIIVRASDPKAIQKFERAGATRIVSPFSSGALKMARFMVTPAVEDFLEIADTHGGELELADLHVDETSPFVGKRLIDTNLRTKGVTVIGVRRVGGARSSLLRERP